MKKFNIILFYFLVIYGCSDNKQNLNQIIVDEFPITITLKSEKIKIPSLLLDPQEMQISDSILTVLQPSSKIKFKFFLLPSCKYLKGYGTDGRGPEDFTNIATGTFTASYNNQLVLIDRRNRIRFFNLNNLMDNNWHPYNSFSLSRKITSTFQLVYDGDSIIYGNVTNEILNAEVYQCNINTQEVSALINYPNTYPGMSIYDKSRVFSQRLGLKPDGSMIASAYYYQKRIRIFELASRHSVEVIYKDEPKPEDISTIKKVVGGYDIRHHIAFFEGDLRTTNKYIYAEMFNKKIADLDYSFLNIKTEIHIFDWEGNPIARCRFEKPIDCYAVTPDNEFLYAVSSTDGGYIKRYSLKEIFKK